jgi:predicted unusual protein kinase regulating ubiquinone biosynthesis (AarF/ABC1/UbiB family)
MKNPEYDDSGAGEPPGGAAERGMMAAKTGLKIGGNYARYLSRRATGTNKEEARNKLHTANATDLFSDLAKLRGTALKMAQGMSLEPGILPEQFSQILAKAQYEVPAMGPTLVRRLVSQALGMEPEQAFAEFAPTAMAAASLGQVHRARLQDGQDVVVKVQYPNVRESIDSDLRIVRGIAGRFLDAKAIDPYLKEVRDRMMEETDYLLEGQNIEFFAERYADTEIVIPRWVSEKTTERVLTMTYVDGVHLKEYLATNPSQAERNRYGQLLWDSVHAQIAADHLTVHADAHPGNFLFREDGNLGLLDFGCIKHFPRQFRDDLLGLFRARMAGDRAAEEEAFLALGILLPEMNQEERQYLIGILNLVGGVINKLYEADQYDFGSGELLADFLAVMPKLSGREAFKHRRPVGSHHFVFVNRLLAGMLSILTQLESSIDTRFAVKCLGTVPSGGTDRLV